MRNLRGIYIIWYRDVKRYFMDRTRTLGTLGMPLLFLLVLGFGLRPKGPAHGGIPYSLYMYPGIVAMSMLFTSSFSAMSIIWDREFGFLKEVLVSPISRWAIVVGKTLGGATQGFFQGVVMLFLLMPFIHPPLQWGSFLLFFPAMFLTSFVMTSLGILIAARMRSFEGFQVVMNFVVMPAFFFSGALYTLDNIPTWLKWITRMDYMAYGVDLLRTLLVGFETFPIWLDLAVLVVFGIFLLSLAVFQFSREG